MITELTNKSALECKTLLEQSFYELHGHIKVSDHFLIASIVQEIETYHYLDQLIKTYAKNVEEKDYELRETIKLRQRTATILLNLLKSSNLLPVIVNRKAVEVKFADPLDSIVPKEVLELEKKSREKTEKKVSDNE